MTTEKARSRVTDSAEMPSLPGSEAEAIAKAFHEVYEQLAPHYGYKTRDDSAVPWADAPEANKALMIATVEALIERGVIL